MMSSASFSRADVKIPTRYALTSNLVSGVIPETYDGYQDYNGSWTATITLPATAPSVGALFHVKNEASFATTILAANTNLSADYLTVGAAPRHVLFAWDGKKWCLVSDKPKVIFPTLSASWSRFNAAYAPLAFAIDSAGIVSVSGSIKSSAAIPSGAVIVAAGVLPAAFRPLNTQKLNMVGQLFSITCEIAPDGSVKFIGTGTANTHYTINGVYPSLWATSN